MNNGNECKCTLICLPTEHQRALGGRFKGDRAFQVKLEFRNVSFCGGRKTGVPREKPSIPALRNRSSAQE